MRLVEMFSFFGCVPLASLPWPSLRSAVSPYGLGSGRAAQNGRLNNLQGQHHGRPERRRQGDLFLRAWILGLVVVLWTALPVQARFEDAPELYFGTVTNDGVPLPDGTRVTVRIQGDESDLSSYTLGALPNLVGAGGEKLYQLVVPVDVVDPQADGTTRPGTVLEFYVDDTLSGQATVEARGLAHELNLDLVNAPGVVLWTADSGCFRWELLGASGLKGTDRIAMRWRLTNRCESPLAETALRFRPGAYVAAPGNGATYAAPSGRSYTATRLTGNNGGVLLTPQGTALANGESDQFNLEVEQGLLENATELWNTAKNQDGSVGGVVVPWDAALADGVGNIDLLMAQACGSVDPETGYTEVTVQWQVHPWSLARKFNLYRLESGNPNPQQLNTQALEVGAAGLVTFLDTLFYSLRNNPVYRIEPLTTGSLQPLAGQSVESGLTLDCQALPTPTPTPPTATVEASGQSSRVALVFLLLLAGACILFSVYPPEPA